MKIMKALLSCILKPVAISIVAITGAIITNHSSKLPPTIVSGYVKGGPGGTICHSPQPCSTEGQSICRLSYPDGTQLFGKYNDMCTLIVYRIEP